MKAYLDDLRERVWRACQDEAMSRSAVAEELDVSRSFVGKRLRRFREEGTLCAVTALAQCALNSLSPLSSLSLNR